MGNTLGDFKAKHDPVTIIAKLSAELDQLKGEQGLKAIITEVMGNVSQRLETLTPPKWVLQKDKKIESPGVPTLFLSDIHAGEVVVPEQINDVNAYNMAICERRMRYTVETAIRLCRILDGEMRYPGIVVPLGGDMVSGDIHEELVATNELPTIPTVLELYEYLVSAIYALLDHFPAIFLPCVGGNHGRNTKKTWAKNRNHTSFDWLLYQMLAKRFKDDKRVTFYIPAGSDGLYRIYNTRYLLTHGDQFKAGDSIIGAIGPIFRGNQKKLARNTAVGQEYDVMINGHWHTYMQTERNCTNGSMKGYDEWAASMNFAFELPRQALFITNPRYGITYRMPVLCDKPPAKKASPAWVSVCS